MQLTNPIYNAEFHYQRYAIRNGRAGRLWILIAVLLVVPPLLASIVMLAAVLVNPLLPIAEPVVDAVAGSPLEAAILVLNIALYVVVTLITQALASNSIGRERRGHTWDNLRLTDISGRQIVIGKWRASLRALWGDHAMIAIMRVGFLATQVYYLLDVLPSVGGLPVEWVHMPLIALIAIIYTALDAALTAALGILGSSSNSELGSGVISVIASTARIITAGAAFLWLLLAFWLMGQGDFSYVMQALVGFVAYGVLIGVSLLAAFALVK